MNEDKKTKYIQAFVASAILAVVLITVLTITAELYKPLKDFLKDVFYHHWIGKGVLSFAGFFALGTLLPVIKIRLSQENRLIHILTITTALCAIAIIVFYFYEFFSAH